MAEKVKENPFEEALRYIENAQKILSEKAGKVGNFYSDPKYVKMACNTAWNGVLVALEAKMKIEKFKFPSRNRKNVDLYRDYLSKINLSILKYFNEAYNLLHLSGGYDGSLVVNVSQDGIKLALKVINWCKNTTQLPDTEKNNHNNQTKNTNKNNKPKKVNNSKRK